MVEPDSLYQTVSEGPYGTQITLQISTFRAASGHEAVTIRHRPGAPDTPFRGLGRKGHSHRSQASRSE